MAKGNEIITAKKRILLAKKIDEVSAPHRSKQIFRSRYGLVDGIVKSNVAVGKRFHISAEAVRLSIIRTKKLIGLK